MLRDHQKQREPVSRILDWLAMVMAFMAALLGAPSLNEATQDIVLEIARGSYPPRVVSMIAWMWMVACFPLVFFAAHAVLLITMKLLTMRVSKGRR